jgi:hypothetical protein
MIVSGLCVHPVPCQETEVESPEYGNPHDSCSLSRCCNDAAQVWRVLRRHGCRKTSHHGAESHPEAQPAEPEQRQKYGSTVGSPEEAGTHGRIGYSQQEVPESSRTGGGPLRQFLGDVPTDAE